MLRTGTARPKWKASVAACSSMAGTDGKRSLQGGDQRKAGWHIPTHVPRVLVHRARSPVPDTCVGCSADGRRIHGGEDSDKRQPISPSWIDSHRLATPERTTGR